MRYEIVLAPAAAKAYEALKAYLRAEVRDAVELYLRHQPTLLSMSRIKRLRDLQKPQYRLRVGKIRIFYDVTAEAVEILAIVSQADSADWLARHGTPDTTGSAG
jgi:mRNA interferase RelE/StbE